MPKDTYFKIDEKVFRVLDDLYKEHGSWELVAENANVHERALYRIRYQNKRISLDLLDKLTIYTKYHLWDFEEV